MYYLTHYFNPDFNYKQLRPAQTTHGQLKHHYLGYVQNVVIGQVLAELVPLEQFPEGQRDPRFIYTEQHLPCGPNCRVSPEKPSSIVAAANGYVFYHNGLITVKKLLNIRGHVGVSTGDILFVGDAAVHGNVQTGFSLRAKNVLVKGHIESSKVKAEGDLVCLAGVKGSIPVEQNVAAIQFKSEAEIEFVPDSLLSARGNVRVPFCERVQVRSAGNIIIDGACLHSTLYVGGNLVIKGRLQGGSLYSNKSVYVEKQLGSDMSSPTKIFMGYNPFDMLGLQKLESVITYLESKLHYYERMMQRSDVMEQEHKPRHDLVMRKLKIAYVRRTLLWKNLKVEEEHAKKCVVLVPGTIMPGCEISIGQAYTVTTFLTAGKKFILQGDEVVMLPLDESELVNRK